MLKSFPMGRSGWLDPVKFNLDKYDNTLRNCIQKLIPNMLKNYINCTIIILQTNKK